MTTEREQLTLAAKACGYPCYKFDGYGQFQIKIDPMASWLDWNPASDDGDCARIEAQLDICIEWSGSWVIAWHGGVQETVLFSNHAGNKFSARRAASVAVAAEIGRMK